MAGFVTSEKNTNAIIFMFSWDACNFTYHYTEKKCVNFTIIKRELVQNPFWRVTFWKNLQCCHKKGRWNGSSVFVGFLWIISATVLNFTRIRDNTYTNCTRLTLQQHSFWNKSFFLLSKVWVLVSNKIGYIRLNIFILYVFRVP